MHLMSAKIISIGEADYGCEERPEGSPLKLSLEIEQDGRRFFVEKPASLVDGMGLKEDQILTDEALSKLNLS